LESRGVMHRIAIVGSADGNPAAEFTARPDEHLLAGMERLGRRGIPVGCRGGGCGVCKVEVLEGQVRRLKMSRDCVSREDEERGLALACRIHAESDLRIRVIGQMKKAFDRAERGAREGSDSVTAGPRPAFDTSWRK